MPTAIGGARRRSTSARRGLGPSAAPAPGYQRMLVEEAGDEVRRGVRVVAGGEVTGPLDGGQAGVGDHRRHLLGALGRQHVGGVAAEHEHGAPQRRGGVGDPGQELLEVVRWVGVGGGLAEAPTHAVLPLPPAVIALAEVAGQALGPHVPALGEVLGDLVGRLLQGRERLVGPHEVDDLAHALGLEAVTDVDQHDPDGSVGVVGRQPDAGEPAERGPDEHRPVHPERVEQRRHGGGDDTRAEGGGPLLGRRRQRRRVGVAVVRQVRGQQVVPAVQRRAQLLVHVGGLATAVEGEHRRQPTVTPLEVVDLPALHLDEAAAARSRDVVAGRSEVVGQRGHGHVRSSAPALVVLGVPGRAGGRRVASGPRGFPGRGRV